MNQRTTAAALSLGLLLAAIPAAVNAAPTARTFTQADCGSSIYASVTLKSNVDCTGAGATAITVAADKLTINLNGYTLIGDAGNDVIDTNGRNGTTIYAGTIEVPEMQSGVACHSSSTVTVNKVTFISAVYRSGYGVYAEYTPKLIVSNSVFSGLDYGLNVTGSGVSVSATNSSDNNFGFYSIYDSSDSFTGGSFSGNATGIASEVANFFTMSSTVADNNDDTGVDLNPSARGVVNISGSYARGNGLQGIFVESPFNGSSATSSIVNTVASMNTANGIVVNHPGPLFTLKGNITDGNGDSGIRVTENANQFGPGTASSNVARGNAYYGLVAQYSMLGSNNKASGNGTDCYNFVCTVTKK